MDGKGGKHPTTVPPFAAQTNPEPIQQQRNRAQTIANNAATGASPATAANAAYDLQFGTAQNINLLQTAKSRTNIVVLCAAPSISLSRADWICWRKTITYSMDLKTSNVKAIAEAMLPNMKPEHQLLVDAIVAEPKPCACMKFAKQLRKSAPRSRTNTSMSEIHTTTTDPSSP
ncbi:hypothetical protein Vafri_13181 [Volvox africanus]|uniref:Uncharacterized protein n=1 Tax=Volvox africanus TaxID=51714 RepID=A0A8J4F3A2_9CHLO|nr:hypothetical protein Vafri_13181 [Volvox africanus]